MKISKSEILNSKSETITNVQNPKLLGTFRTFAAVFNSKFKIQYSKL